MYIHNRIVLSDASSFQVVKYTIVEFVTGESTLFMGVSSIQVGSNIHMSYIHIRIYMFVCTCVFKNLHKTYNCGICDR